MRNCRGSKWRHEKSWPTPALQHWLAPLRCGLFAIYHLPRCAYPNPLPFKKAAIVAQARGRIHPLRGRKRKQKRCQNSRIRVKISAHTKRCMTIRSEEHTSELQSRGHLVCRLLLEKKKKTHIIN